MISQMNGDSYEDETTKPLDNQKILFTEDGLKKEIPALDRKWVVERYLLPYIPPPHKVDGSFALGAKENWLEQVKTYCQDMKWLLQLKQNQFWSQVMYDSSTIVAIVSFLQDALPYYAMNDFPSDEEMFQAYTEAYHLVLLVINRLATIEESETSYFTPNFYGKMIYQHYVFTIPIILDLCLLCGQNNRSIVIRIVNLIFKVQPLYLEDLKKSVPCVLQVLQSVSQYVGLKMPLDTEPERITPRERQLTPDDLSDVILHVLDTACTLSVLTDVFSPACKIFHQDNIELRLVWFYENVVPELYSKLETLVNVDEEPALFISLKNKLDMTRIELLKIFRNALFCNINSAIESSEPTEVMNSIDDYITILTECLTDKLFIQDYHRLFNVGQDLDLLSQLSPDIDADKRSYILEAVIDPLTSESFSRPSSPVLSSKFGNIRIKERQGEDALPSTSSSGTQDVSDLKTEEKKVSGVKLDSLISQVKDILPHLGDGFIEYCLQHYNFVSEDVINAILEGKLPSSLNEMDHELPRIPPENEPTVPKVEINIVSDDEEPHFAQAHKGKRKDVYRDVMMMINDKSHREDMREFYTPFSLYEDEYDDTYDDRLGVTLGDDDDPERNSSKISNRPQPVAATSGGGATVSSSEDSDSDDGATGNNFVANPEKLRAIREQQRLAKGYNKPQRRDVVGKPKGQGQDKNVVTNRNQKTAHKGQRANHNRRTGAQWKRQQGMFPS